MDSDFWLLDDKKVISPEDTPDAVLICHDSSFYHLSIIPLYISLFVIYFNPKSLSSTVPSTIYSICNCGNHFNSLQMIGFVSSVCLNKLLNRRFASCASSDGSHLSLFELRKNYSKIGIDEKCVPDDPMQLFTTWITEVSFR